MKSKTKKILFRLISSTTIVFMLLNIIITMGGFGGVSRAGIGDALVNALDQDATAKFEWYTGLGFVLILALRLLIILIGIIGQAIMAGVYSGLEGTTKKSIGVEDIIFAGANGRSKFLDADFLSDAGSSTITEKFRTSVAQWYYSLRVIAAAALLVILVYVGIRMALSTVGQSQAKYKEMFMNWVVSVALLFLLHWIIAFVFMVNHAFIEGLNSGNAKSAEMLTKLLEVFWEPGVHGTLAAVLYTMLVGQIFMFFVLYVKRMITVGFLIMISPLITITYSIDKIGDNKAQALSAWLKELCYNVLIQPFHCVIFLSFYSAMADQIDSSITPYIFCIILLNFMRKAEDIVRNIFHFEAKHMSSMADAGQSVANARGSFVKLGTSTTKAFSTFKSAGGMKALTAGFKDIGKNKTKTSKFGKKAATAAAGLGGGSQPSTMGQQGSNLPGGNAPVPKTTAQKMKAKVDESRKRREEKAIEKRARKKFVQDFSKESLQQADNGVPDAKRKLNEYIENERVENETKKSVNKQHHSYKELKKAEAQGNAGAHKFLEEERKIARHAPKNELESQVKKAVDKTYGKNAYEKIKDDAKEGQKLEDIKDPNEKNKAKKARQILKDAKKQVVDENVKNSLGEEKYNNLKAQEEKDIKDIKDGKKNKFSKETQELNAARDNTTKQLEAQQPLDPVQKYAPDNEFDNQVKKIVDKDPNNKKKYGKNAYEQIKNEADNGNRGAKQIIEKAEEKVKEKNVKKTLGTKQYNELKQQAEADKKAGKRQSGAATVLNEEGNAVKDRLTNQSPKRAISGARGVANNQNSSETSDDSQEKAKPKRKIWGKQLLPPDKIYANARQKEFWEASKALLQDSTKVAAAIAFGGLAMGATANFQDAFSAGQFGYGVASGILENSAKTVTTDATDKYEKILKLLGENADNARAMFDAIKTNGAIGVIDTTQAKKDLEDMIKNYISSGNKKQMYADINNYLSTDGAELDEEILFQKYFSASQGANDNADEIKDALKEYLVTLNQAALYKEIEKAENVGMKASTLADKVESQVDVNVSVNSNGSTRVNARSRGVDQLNVNQPNVTQYTQTGAPQPQGGNNPPPNNPQNRRRPTNPAPNQNNT